jgi:pimeloyl-ACP methyl ester carboxylesterase
MTSRLGKVTLTLLLIAAAYVSRVYAAEVDSQASEKPAEPSPEDLKKFFGWFEFFQKRSKEKYVSGQALFDATAKLDPNRLAAEFKLPVFVIQGAQDCTTPAELAKRWLDSISAPRKHFATIPGQGHFAAFIKSDEFLRALLADVLPLARAKPGLRR